MFSKNATKTWAEKNHPLNTSSDLSSSSASSALVVLDISSVTAVRRKERCPTQQQCVPKKPESFLRPFDRVLRSTLGLGFAYQGQCLSKWRVQARQ